MVLQGAPDDGVHRGGAAAHPDLRCRPHVEEVRPATWLPAVPCVCTPLFMPPTSSHTADFPCQSHWTACNWTRACATHPSSGSDSEAGQPPTFPLCFTPGRWMEEGSLQADCRAASAVAKTVLNLAAHAASAKPAALDAPAPAEPSAPAPPVFGECRVETP